MKATLAKSYRFLLILALIPALLILSLRVGLPHLSRFTDEIASHLGYSIGMNVQLGSLSASLDRWQVNIQLENITLLSQDEFAPTFSLKAARLDLTLDLWRSLKYQTLIFSDAALQQADLLLQQYEGHWLPSINKDPTRIDQSANLLSLLKYQPNIMLQDVSVGLQPEHGAMQFISPVNAMFEALSGEYQLSGSMRMPRMGDDAYVVFALHALTYDVENPLLGHYRFYLQSDALGSELLSLGILPLELKALDLSTQIWGEWKDRQLTELQGHLSMTPLAIADDRWPEIESLAMQFAFIPLDEQRYQLQLRDIHAISADIELSLTELIADFNVPSKHQAAIELLRVSTLDLAALHHWVDQFELLPDSIEATLERLSPEGKVSDLLIYWHNPEDLMDFVLQARLDEVAVSAWEDAPEASGISGFLQAGPDHGKIMLESAEFTLNFPELFGSGWQYSEATGEVSWQVTGEALRLNSGLLRLSNQDIQANGRFGLYRPFDSEEQIEFSLLIGVTDSDALQTEFYMPPKELGETLFKWLKTSIRSGKVNQAGLMIHAGLRPTAHHLPVSVQLFLDADQAEFAFDPEWPSVQQGRLFLHLRNTELRIDIASGHILNSAINSAWVYLPPNSQQLQIAALLQGDASDFSVLLQESALGGLLGEGLTDLKMAGQTTTRLSLQVPVGGENTLGVQVNSLLQGSRLHLQDRDLHFTDIDGRILYTTQDGLRSEQLTGRLFNQALSATIQTQSDRTQIAVQGQIATDHLNQLTGVSFPQRIKGQSHVDMTLTLCSQTQHCPRIELATNLSGTSIDLPLGLGKSEDELRSVWVDYLPQQQRFHFGYDDLLQGAFDLSVPLKGQLLFGKGVAVIPFESHLDVVGELPEISLQGSVTRQGVNDWQVDLRQLHLRQLHSRSAEIENPVEVASIQDAYSAVDVSQFPNLALQIESLRLNDLELGEWSLQMRPQGQGVSVESIKGRLLDFSMNGQAHWQASESPMTHFSASVSGNNLADMFEHWSQGRPIETKLFNASTQLNWQGSPWQFNLASLNGPFHFQADDGRIVESGAGANLLRIFGLLNLNTLSRRLRLDFSDLLQRGLVFDTLAAEYELQQGVAIIREPLKLAGPSANMEISGQVNLNTRQLDKTIRVSVPLGSNLTLGAILLGAPQVAGALFIFDQLMGDRIEKMTRIAYTLTGDWKEPQLNLLNPIEG